MHIANVALFIHIGASCVNLVDLESKPKSEAGHAGVPLSKCESMGGTVLVDQSSGRIE